MVLILLQKNPSVHRDADERLLGCRRENRQFGRFNWLVRLDSNQRMAAYKRIGSTRSMSRTFIGDQRYQAGRMKLDQAPAVHRRTCPFCEAMCGVRIAYDGDRVLSVRPDPDNDWSRGHMCPKGTVLGDLHHDPDRLRSPMIREGSRWREASWSEAFSHVRMLHSRSRQAHPESLQAAFVGNMAGKGFDMGRHMALAIKLAKLDQIYSSSTVDQHPKNLVCQLLYGDMWRFPIPDIDRTDLLLMMGANPAESKGSAFSHRDVLAAMRALRARGGIVRVVDPVRTRSAEQATEWIGIRPGTDAAFLLAVAHVIFASEAVRLRHFAGAVTGLDQVREIAARFPPERVARFCNIPAERIQAIAQELIDTDRSAIYGRIGLCTQEFGTLASWMCDVLAIITGNLDREGGMMWSRQVAAHLELAPPFPVDAPVVTGRSRVRGISAILGQFPASCLAEEIATEGPGQIRRLLTIAANPVLSAPSAGRLDAALPELDCMVSLDAYINETTRHAHVILPSPSLLEQPHWDIWSWVFNLTSGGAFEPSLFPIGDRPPEWEVLIRLGAIFGGIDEPDPAAIDDEYFTDMCRLRGIDPEVAVAARPERGPIRVLDLAIRTGEFGDRYGARPGGLSLASFEQVEGPRLFGPAAPWGRDALRTPDRTIDVAPAHILADIPRLEEKMAKAVEGLTLVSRRQLRSLNSWLHNMPSLVKGKDRCTLQINPCDASALGISESGRARVTSEEDSVEVLVEITEAVLPGVVSLPHGWGHGAAGARLQVAREHAGVNTNLLSPGRLVDVPSGNAVVNGFPVRVEPVVTP